MSRSTSRERFGLRALAAGFCAFCFLASADAPAHAAKPRDLTPAPVLTIPVDPLGYMPPGQLYLLARYSTSTLNFLDANHLLFTFREPRLLRRDQHGRDQDEDQMIHAVVLELPGGKVTASADWRLHDRRKYLWPLSGGKVLLRRGNEVLETDKTLVLQPLLRFTEPLRELYVSPGGRAVVTETTLERHTPAEHARLQAEADLLGQEGPPEDVRVTVIRLDSRAIELTARADQEGRVNVNSAGMLSQSETKPNQWVIRFHPFQDFDPKGGPVLAELPSLCAPEENYLSDDVMLVLTCSARTPDRIGQGIAMDGRKLWSGSWRATLVWPTVEPAESGADFAIGWIGVSHPVDTYDPLNDSDVQAEIVDVIDTRDGAFRFSIAVQPVISAGQNFSLSPDGSRLAVLNRGAIEIYQLPAPGPPMPPPRGK